ncbi:hypothetical protein [Phytoactinopolyspora limicola]|uniref:hypothetical protein n=1 Tax=Phytoactinopolyspora limicola TaxID=2715536 RepID=UPI00140CE338|nr:hypothetical protein [Phytoactinopolyspora limicola]
MTQVSNGVRPTKRCLTDLDVPLPDLGHPLDEITHRVVADAQAIPEQRDAGGAERISSLRDRVWFKVKSGDYRGAVTNLRGHELPNETPTGVGEWWIGAAGHRQADSPQRDFYETIKRECTVGKTISTTRLLPVDWDWKRLAAEHAVAWRREMKHLVIRLIAMSLTTGDLAVAEFRQHRLKALARAGNGHEAYLAIIAEGIPDPEVFALLLDCVPGISVDDWQPEPSPLADMKPSPGEIIWSTLLPSAVAHTILELADAIE